MSDALREDPPRDVLRALRWMTERAPAPVLVTEGPTHLVRHANPAFLALFARASAPVGRPLQEAFPELPEETRSGLLDVVYATGKARRTAEFEHVDPRRGARVLALCLADVCAIELIESLDTVALRVSEPEVIARETACAITCARARALGIGAPFVRMTEGDAADEVLAGELRALGFASGMVIPLSSPTRVQGVLTVLSRTAPLDPADIVLIGETADRISMAIDRVDLYRKAVRAARAREELLATVSHDLRSPLHTIVFSAALIEKSAASPGSSEARHLERIRRTAEYMDHLLADLVDSAKIEEHRFLVDPAPCALAPLVTDVVEMMSPLAARKAIRLETKIDPAAASSILWMDRARMSQVLTNLLGNAVKFTPEGGSIAVHVELRPGSAILSVRDSGAGMPKEDLERVFDRYWQARQTAQLGTGLGLFIARGIVTAHGGTIWAESELGAGSSFFVSIPTSPASEAREGAGDRSVA
ncbi:MAG: GAF domain-containing sensor histidine kinase [Byssovorax sp.]